MSILKAVGLFLCVGVAHANDFLPQTFKADFEQEFVSTLKSKVKKGNGSIEYKYPGHIRFETNTPSTVIYVSNNVQSWYYRAPFVPEEQGEVTITNAKSGATPFTKFFDALKNGLTSNVQYAVEKKEDRINLAFTEAASKDYGIKKAELFFNNKSQVFKDITTIEITFNDNKTSKLKFNNLKTNETLGADRFNFTPPANTKVVD